MNEEKDKTEVMLEQMNARLNQPQTRFESEIREAPFKVVESFTVPLAGDVSLTEAKSIWPDKILFVNCPPHLVWGEPEEVRKGYEAIAKEWGNKKGLLSEHIEAIPLGKEESHLGVGAALAVFGY